MRLYVVLLFTSLSMKQCWLILTAVATSSVRASHSHRKLLSNNMLHPV